MEQDQVEAFIARMEEADELFGLDEVISAYEALIPNLKQVLGDTHHLTLSAHQALADYLSLDSRDAEATALLEAFIVDLPDDYQGRRVTAEVLGSLERFDDQVATLEALIADQSEALGTDHPDVRNCHHRLSDALCAAGRPEDAITTLEVLIADQSDALGSDHVDLFDSRYQLSEALCAADRFDEAIATLESLITDEQRVRGADDPDVLAARSVLSFMLRDAGQFDNAIATREALIADEERVFGSESSELLATRSALGRLLGEAGRTDEAVGILKEVLTDQRRVFGPEDPLTESTAEALADLQRSVRMQAKRKGAPKNWLHYWKFKSAKGADVLRHAASSQFIKRGVAVGDRIYVISYQGGEFFLVGSAVVGKFATDAETRRELGYEPYEAGDHIIFEAPVEARLDRVIPLEVLRGLHFETQQGTKPISLGPNGVPSPSGFQALRNLTSSSARDLDQLL